MSRRSRHLLLLFATLASTACKHDQPSREADPQAESQVTTLGQGGEAGEGPLSLRVLSGDELTPAIIGKAQEILDQYRNRPLGYQVSFELAGKRYVARLEQHYHPPGSNERPVGEHLGVTVYVLE